MIKNTKILNTIIILVAVVIGAVIIFVNSGKNENELPPENAVTTTETADAPAEKQDAKEASKPAENKADKKTEEKKADKKADKKAEEKKETEKKESTKTKNEQPVKVQEQTQEENIKPQFLYFVDNSSEKFAEEIIKELEGKYPEILYEIKNIEKNPDILKNFGFVEGNIPALITVDKTGMLGFEFKCSDKAKLEEHAKKISGK